MNPRGDCILSGLVRTLRKGFTYGSNLLVNCVDTIRQYLIEKSPFLSVTIPVKPQNMIRIDRAHCLVYSLIERWKAVVLRIGRFIDRIVPSNPCVALVSGGNLLPQPHCTILEILVLPKGCVSGWIVGVPTLILAARSGVHI